MLGLTKGSGINFLLSSLFFTSGLISIILLDGLNFHPTILVILLFDTVLYLAFKLTDNGNKQKYYEGLGYTYLTTTEKGETVLARSNMILKESYIFLAVFDETGLLKRQTRVTSADVELAQLLLNKR